MSDTEYLQALKFCTANRLLCFEYYIRHRDELLTDPVELALRRQRRRRESTRQRQRREGTEKAHGEAIGFLISITEYIQ